jgi:hypothetical protein
MKEENFVFKCKIKDTRKKNNKIKNVWMNKDRIK